jgi:hypothetical protein
MNIHVHLPLVYQILGIIRMDLYTQGLRQKDGSSDAYVIRDDLDINTYAKC